MTASNGRPVTDSERWTKPVYQITLPQEDGTDLLFHLTVNEDHHNQMVQRLQALGSEPFKAERLDTMAYVRPRPIISDRELDTLEPGRCVRDPAGDVWLKEESGEWRFGEDRLSSDHLFHAWAPLELIAGRYAA